MPIGIKYNYTSQTYKHTFADAIATIIEWRTDGEILHCSLSVYISIDSYRQWGKPIAYETVTIPYVDGATKADYIQSLCYHLDGTLVDLPPQDAMETEPGIG